MKKKFKITGMHCSSCALTIDMDLEDLPGVKSSSTSYAKQVTEVEFDSDKVTDDLILQTIKKSGYTAQAL
ncbi:hypothetical protein A3J19_03445 [Candidatus Daviesbacteria bacterium RIFCSPLOWO2_02_FULL_41_8]|uniref:HMA domain-containing protein n=1 Tax=Candidatus Daviesbacteria bacterium RIFCSPLOWO2_02_FULL_41_8 TaxID=1797798 RepID=A0A1F5NH01_9BACT|nr:MAG: hypothetical protein A3J19_03445 [Candidatus Daviesbacteria bacterium RIFCSPLOWO2_02_FULL_41_8]